MVVIIVTVALCVRSHGILLDTATITQFADVDWHAYVFGMLV